MAKKRRLTVRFVEDVAPPAEGYELYPDEHGFGLKLRVMSGGTKNWIQRLSVHSKPTNIGLGSYPLTSLAEARDKAFANAKLARDGGDPLAAKREQRRVPTVKQAVQSYVTLRAKTWKTERQSRDFERPFVHHVYPKIGTRRINTIETSDLTKCLIPILTAKPAVAGKLRTNMTAVFGAAVAEGYCDSNPAEAIKHVLPTKSKPTTNHAAVAVRDIPEVMRLIRESDAKATVRLACEFQVLTAAQPSEARLAEWSEIDLDEAVWTISAERMKASRDHQVPLSDRALEVLREAQAVADGGDLIFPSLASRTPGKAFADRSVPRLIQGLGINATAHGFRSSFRDWCGEVGVDREVAELALAHMVGNATEQAYARSALLQRRSVVMQQWADYTMGREAETVVDLKARRVA